MATVFRGPTYAQQQRNPPLGFWAGSNLLVTTLAVAAVAVPFGNSGSFPAQPQHPSHALSANADTSKGSAKTLYADSVSPQFNPASIQIDRLRPAVDTSRGVLPGSLLAPFVNPPQHAVDRQRPVADTSQFQIPPATFVPAPFTAYIQTGIERPRQSGDTSQSVPQALIPVIPPGTPFAQVNWPNAIEYRQQYTPKWDWQAYPGSIPDALPVVAGGAADYETKKRKKKLEAEVARVNREILAEEKTQAAEKKAAEPLKKAVKTEAKKARAQPVVAEIKLAAEPAWDDEDDIETLLLSL